jgi:hypothetical protein
MNKILKFLLKIKLINTKNFIFVITQRLYKLTDFVFFKKIAILNSVNFKSLPSHYLFFENIIKLLENKKIQFKFEESNVIEIGGGEFWGLLPFFAQQKAKSYTNIDLIVDNRINKTRYIWSKFKKKISSYCSCKLINKIDVKVYNEKIENLFFKNSFDYIVSISCLEHVQDLNSLFKNLKKYSSKETKHLHIINFSNHLNKKYPFKYLYENKKIVFNKKFNNTINLLRPSDYRKILDLHNFKYKLTVLDTYPLDKHEIIEDWTDKYTMDDLSIITAIITIEGYSN